MDPSYGDQVIEAPPEDDEEQKKPAPPASTGSPFIDALIGAVTGADLPSTGGGTNAAVDDPRGYGTDYAPSSPAPDYAFAPPAGNNGMDDPRGYGDAYGGRPSPNDAGGTGVDTYGPPAPPAWGATNAAPASDTPWSDTPYFPGASAFAAPPHDWGNTNASPTATEIPPFAGGLFDPWTSSAEAAGTTKNPVTAMREAEETQTARNTNATATAQAGVNRDARTATALAVNDTRHAAASATADARREAGLAATETARGVSADRTAVAQETRDARSAAATATKEALMAGTPEAQQRAADAKDVAIATKEARSEAATATKEAASANATATKESEKATPTATPAPDPDKDAAEGAKLLADALKMEQDAPENDAGMRQTPPEARMIREQGEFLLNRARTARGLPTYTPTPQTSATPTANAFGAPDGTPGPTQTATPAPSVGGGILDAISSLFRRGGATPEALAVQPDATTDTMYQYGSIPTATPGAPAYDPAQADAIAAGRNAEESYAPMASAPAPRTRTSAIPTLPVGDYGGDTSGGAVPIDPDLMGKGATGADQQAFLDGILARIPGATKARPVPGEPGALPVPEETPGPTATTIPPPRNGAVAATRSAPSSGGGSVTIPPAVEQYRPIYEKYFGDLGPAAVDHIMQLNTLESGGNALAHNTNGEDSRGLGQINIGPGANTDLARMDLFNPEANVRAQRIVYDRAGWGAWSTEALLQRGAQDRAMPGEGGLPGTVSPGDMTAAATAGRPKPVAASTLDADQAAALEQAAGREAGMPGAGAKPTDTTPGATGAKTPRPALTGNEAIDNAQWIVWMRQNNPGWTPPAGAEDDAAKKAAAGPHKGDIPTNKPSAADPGFKVGTSIPVSATNTYRLSDGTTKTLDDMKTELRNAGWAGDVGNVQAVLEAYQRTVGKTLSPAAAGPLSAADRQAKVSKWTPNIAQVGAGLNVPADVALAAIDVISQGSADHAGGLMGVPAGSVPAGTPLEDGNTSIKAGLTALSDLYKANGNDWAKAFGAYLTNLGIPPGAIDGAVAYFNTARSTYAAPPPPAPATGA